jgi:hypothetical protein
VACCGGLQEKSHSTPFRRKKQVGFNSGKKVKSHELQKKKFKQKIRVDKINPYSNKK